MWSFVVETSVFFQIFSKKKTKKQNFVFEVSSCADIESEIETGKSNKDTRQTQTERNGFRVSVPKDWIAGDASEPVGVQSECNRSADVLEALIGMKVNFKSTDAYRLVMHWPRNARNALMACNERMHWYYDTVILYIYTCIYTLILCNDGMYL